jgi:hypothetical protein
MERSRFLICFFCFLSFAGMAQTELKEMLRSAGFEQLRIKEEGDTLKIFFEHRNFRNPYASLQLASAILDGKTEKELKFVLLYHNRPMVIYDEKSLKFHTVSKEDRKWFKEFNWLPDYRFNFRLMPDFSVSFGNLEMPYANRTNIILDTRIYIFPGFSLHTGLLIPINNTLDSRDMKLNLGPTHLSYFMARASRHFVIAHGGLFLSDRYGGELQYRYAPLSSQLSMGISGSLTGFYIISNGVFYKGSMENWTTLLDIEWRLPLTGLVLKGTAGQFLFGDRGYRVDFIRQFGSLDFGLHLANTDYGRAVGFQMAFPLFPGKIIRSKSFELRTTEEYRWEYSYFQNDPAGRYFRTGMPRLEDVIRQYQVHFIQGQRKYY